MGLVKVDISHPIALHSMISHSLKCLSTTLQEFIRSKASFDLVKMGLQHQRQQQLRIQQLAQQSHLITARHAQPTSVQQQPLLFHIGKGMNSGLTGNKARFTVDFPIHSLSFTSKEDEPADAENLEMFANPVISTGVVNGTAMSTPVCVSSIDAQTIGQLSDKIKQLMTENTQLRDAVQTNSQTLTQAYERLANFEQGASRERAEHVAKYEKVKDVVTTLRQKIAEQEQMIQAMKFQTGQLSQPGDAGSVQAKLTAMTSQYEQAKTQNQQLQGEITELKRSIEHCRTEAQNDKQELKQKSKQLEQLMIDFHEMLEKHETSSKKEQELSSSCREREIKIDNLTAQLMSAEDAFGLRNEEIKKQQDTLAILTTQVELYRSDFEAERKSREELNDKKNALEVRVQHLEAELHRVTAPMSPHNSNAGLYPALSEAAGGWRQPPTSHGVPSSGRQPVPEFSSGVGPGSPARAPYNWPLAQPVSQVQGHSAKQPQYGQWPGSDASNQPGAIGGQSYGANSRVPVQSSNRLPAGMLEYRNPIQASDDVTRQLEFMSIREDVPITRIQLVQNPSPSHDVQPQPDMRNNISRTPYGEQFKSPVQPTTEIKDYPCPFCSHLAPDVDSLQLHVNDNHPE